MAEIVKNIYVLRDMSSMTQPIEYMQGTDAIDIVFRIRDYEIPKNAVAKVYVHRPNGSGEYDLATINGNDVLVDVKRTFFSKTGKNYVQIRLTKNEEELVTFAYPVNVKENLVPDFMLQNGNSSDFLDDYLDRIDKRIDITNEQLEIAEKSVAEAKISETNAINSATLSKSYAVGGTNTRNGEDTDNSKYYSQKSETYMENAQVSSREALFSYGKAEACANQSKQSENNAKQSEINAKDYYNLTSALNEKVTKTKTDVQKLANQVASDKEEVDETIKNSLLENSEEILETIKSYFERAEALYSSMYLDCDGETPYLRTVTPIVIDGENPIQRNINIGIDFDGGTPLSRQLAL